MFCGLGEKERTRFRKKKKEKGKKVNKEREKEKKGKKRRNKQKNLIAANSGLVGMKGYFKTSNRVKHICRTSAVFD